MKRDLRISKQTYTNEKRPTHMKRDMKQDLQKRHTKDSLETRFTHFTRFTHCTHFTHCRETSVGQKRRKETCNTDTQKRPFKETYKGDLQKETLKRDLQ